MPRSVIRLAAYTLAHFSVDFGCIFLLYSWYASSSSEPTVAIVAIVAYNLLAFALQPAIGLLADQFPRLPLGQIGCGLVLLGFACALLPLLFVILAGIGNAAFHVGGGRDTLLRTRGKLTSAGVFVSSGAIGVALGVSLGNMGYTLVLLPVACLSASLVLLLVFARPTRPGQDSSETVTSFGISSPTRAITLVVGAFVLIVAVRSMVGAVIPMPWKIGLVMAVLVSLCAAGGKILGAVLADRFGAGRVGVISIAMSIPCLLFGFTVPALCLVGVLLLNMTMPITLCGIAERMPTRPGLAFGITAATIVCVTLPVWMLALDVIGYQIFAGVCLLLSLFLLVLATRKANTER